MQYPINFICLTPELYLVFYSKIKDIDFGPTLLPNIYSEKLWGIIACQEGNVIGGWVGQLRGDVAFARFFAKGVWFDSFPILFDTSRQRDLLADLIDFAKKEAKSQGIIILNITHWSRQVLTDKAVINFKEKNATFLLSLKKDIDILWNEADSTLRNKIRKGIKNKVEVSVLQGQEAIPYLENFQQIRGKTQQRAISKNSKASMLLKSADFFESIMQKCNSFLFVAKSEQKIVAMALMIQCGRTMYYYSGGSDLEANKRTGASSFLIWKAICFAKDLNLNYFDMGGVPLNPKQNHPAYGVYEFKKSFGGEYEEFDSGKIVIKLLRYKVLMIILKNQSIIRQISRKE